MSKSTIITGVNGSIVNFSNLSESTIIIDDIVERLASIRRYNGGTKRYFSVAQHSLVMQKVLRAKGATYKVQQLALMHDMTEAFMGDMVGPLKVLFPEFSEMEDKLFDVICQQLDIPNDFTAEEWAQVKEIDREIRLAEWYVLNNFKIIDPAGAWASEYDLTQPIQSIYVTSIDMLTKYSEAFIVDHFMRMWRMVLNQAEGQRYEKAE